MAKISLGPLLGIEGDNRYTICFLSDNSIQKPTLQIEGRQVSFSAIAETPKGKYWRSEFDIEIPADGVHQEYHIIEHGIQQPLQNKFKQKSWQFYVPSKTEYAKFAFAACNGFSAAKLAKKTEHPYLLWEEMEQLHEENPFSMLLMGGDQLYADEIWDSEFTRTISRWNHLSRSKKLKYKVTKTLSKELNRFYEALYSSKWNTSASMTKMMASIPSVMMWDDHDIFDGWGSHDDKMQASPMFQEIYKYARFYFELFQVRTRSNQTLINKDQHYSSLFHFRDHLILNLDNRSQRTRTQVMDANHWRDIKQRLDQVSEPVKHFWIQTGIPLVYRSFAAIEAYFDATPWVEEGEDDVHDHWTAKPHQAERMKAIVNLLDYTKRFNSKSIILSGDVHIGALGVIADYRDKDTPRTIHQVISTAIVHPTPSFFEWVGLKTVTSDKKEELAGGTITTEMLTPYGSDKYIRSRNFATLQEGSDGKVWVNWICEENIQPSYCI